MCICFTNQLIINAFKISMHRQFQNHMENFHFSGERYLQPLHVNQSINFKLHQFQAVSKKQKRSRPKMTFGTDSSFVFCFRDAVSKTVSEKLFPKCSFQKLFLNVVSETLFQKCCFRKINSRKAISENQSSENQPPKSSKSMLSLGTPSESSRSSTDLVIIGGPHIRYKASSGASWFFR